jgi:hypothetical protein
LQNTVDSSWLLKASQRPKHFTRTGKFKADLESRLVFRELPMELWLTNKHGSHGEQVNLVLQIKQS